MRLMIPALLLLTLLLPSAVAAEPAVSRARFVYALWVGAGALPYRGDAPFTDVPLELEEAPAICWAYDLGVVRGTGGNLFTPQRPITREEAAVLLRRYAACLGRDTFYPEGVAACNEYEGISPWADDSLYWAAGTGLMDWSPTGELDPAGTLTHQQLRTVLSRFFDRPLLQTEPPA